VIPVLGIGADDPAGDLPEAEFGDDAGGVDEDPQAADVDASANGKCPRFQGIANPSS
jgi:hypothetical protein